MLVNRLLSSLFTTWRWALIGVGMPMLLAACQGAVVADSSQSGIVAMRDLGSFVQCPQQAANAIIAPTDHEQWQKSVVEAPALGESLWLITMGQQPTAGYRIALNGPARYNSANGYWQILVQWQQPEPGRRVAQILTQPCLLVAGSLPLSSVIEVVDQGGRVRARHNAQQ